MAKKSSKKKSAPKKKVVAKKKVSPKKKQAAPKPAPKKTAKPVAKKIPALTGRYFGEENPTIDGHATFDGTFIDASDNTYYNSAYYKSHAAAVQPFKTSQSPAYMDLADVLPGSIDAIKKAGKIIFHSLGDTGATSLSKWGNEESVAELMSNDVMHGGASFLFHLGDVVYNFGEANYYYEEFYDPYRFYQAPIFAIPGNHDGMIFDQKMKSLDAFYANFCAPKPGPAVQAGGLIRSTMNQPGVYFTLDAPFVSIIGLYSNVIDNGPGVISSQGGKFPTVGDTQLTFLKSELARLKKKRATDPRAVLIAVHHPPFTGSAKHGGSPRMSQDLDDAFKSAGMWPDAIISGHAHNYERFSRTVEEKAIPYIIAGSGGYNNTPIKNPPAKFPFAIPGRTDLAMENYYAEYGYLEITSDGNARKLTIAFKAAKTGTSPAMGDSVVVNW